MTSASQVAPQPAPRAVCFSRATWLRSVRPRLEVDPPRCLLPGHLRRQLTRTDSHLARERRPCLRSLARPDALLRRRQAELAPRLSLRRLLLHFRSFRQEL